MRILLLAGSYPPETGGIAQYMFDFAHGLERCGVQVDVIANPQLPVRGYLRRIQACREAVALKTRTAKYDRIVASSWSPYAVSLPSPYDVFCHGMDILEPRDSARYRILMRKTLRGAARILTNSHYTADLAIESGARRESVVVLNPGVDVNRFKASASSAKNGATLLSIGRMVERKGFDVVLRALPQLVKSFPNLRYVCAGDGPELQHLQALAGELGVAKYVEWPGEVGEQRKLDLYAGADVFVMPNRIVKKGGSVEGFGIVFIEAAACGIPSIAGNSGGAPDAVVDGVTGYLVNPTNIEVITEKIATLLSTPSLRHQLGSAARQRAESSFRSEQIAERYLAAL